jgi:hypothetical protein
MRSHQPSAQEPSGLLDTAQQGVAAADDWCDGPPVIKIIKYGAE